MLGFFFQVMLHYTADRGACRRQPGDPGPQRGGRAIQPSSGPPSQRDVHHARSVSTANRTARRHITSVGLSGKAAVSAHKSASGRCVPSLTSTRAYEPRQNQDTPRTKEIFDLGRATFHTSLGPHNNSHIREMRGKTAANGLMTASGGRVASPSREIVYEP